MTAVALGLSDWRREVALAPAIQLTNRYFEKTPDPEHGPVSLLARPGLKRFVTVGDGPIRGVYSCPGTFDDDLFSVSGNDLYRVTGDGVASNIGTVSVGGQGQVSFAATPVLGETPEYLFIAEGGVLYLYTESGSSRGHLAASAIADTDTVQIDGVYYRFVNGSVDTGTPDGSTGNPWLVKRTGVLADDMISLYEAIGDTGTPGTDYSTALTAHPTVAPYSVSGGDLYITALALGALGDTLSTTETGANMAWDATTLEDGGTAFLRQVPTPDDVGIISVGYIAGYIICVCADGDGVNGRYYWIEPGETEIDGLNFATAERAPDPCYSVRVVGDQFWLLGSASVEPWYLTGQDAAPFARQQARVFDRGIWQGTDVQVKDIVVLVDATDGAIYAIGGQGPQRISDSSIEERVRKAMLTQTQQGQ